MATVVQRLQRRVGCLAAREQRAAVTNRVLEHLGWHTNPGILEQHASSARSVHALPGCFLKDRESPTPFLVAITSRVSVGIATVVQGGKTGLEERLSLVDELLLRRAAIDVLRLAELPIINPSRTNLAGPFVLSYSGLAPAPM